MNSYTVIFFYSLTTAMKPKVHDYQSPRAPTSSNDVIDCIIPVDKMPLYVCLCDKKQLV